MQLLPASSPPQSGSVRSPQSTAGRREGPSAFRKVLDGQAARETPPDQLSAGACAAQDSTAAEGTPPDVTAPDLARQALAAALMALGPVRPAAEPPAAGSPPPAMTAETLAQRPGTQPPLWQPASAEAAVPAAALPRSAEGAAPQPAPDKLMEAGPRPQTAPAQSSGQPQEPIRAAASQPPQPAVQARQEPEGEARVLSDSGRPLFQQLEHTPVKVAEAPVADAQSPRFEDALAKPIQKALAEGAQTLEIKLAPAHLGSVTVSLTQNPDGTLHVTFLTVTDKAARLLSEHSGGLMQLLRPGAPTGVQIEVQQSDQGQPGQEDRQNQGQRDPRQQEHRQQRERQGSDDFLQQLRLGLLPLTAEAG